MITIHRKLQPEYTTEGTHHENTEFDHMHRNYTSTEKELSDGNSLFGFFDVVPELMCILSANSTILVGNSALARLMCCSRSQLLRRRLESLILSADRPAFQLALNRLKIGDSTTRCEVRLATDRAAPLYIAFSLSYCEKSHRVYVIGRECSADVELRLELARRCREDELTGLLNRSGLLQLASLRIKGALPTEEYGFLFLDLDEFKPVNDRYGHRVGDEVLAEAGRRLKASVETEDLVARYGGDEFVICAATKGAKTPESVLAAVKASFTRPFKVGGLELMIGISIGLASYPADGRQVDELIETADKDMYKRKSSGHLSRRWYERDPAM